jgi:hypothetical protein
MLPWPFHWAAITGEPPLLIMVVVQPFSILAILHLLLKQLRVLDGAPVRLISSFTLPIFYLPTYLLITTLY